MPVTVSEGKVFPPHPTGQFVARCIDVIPYDAVQTMNGKRDKVVLRFFCGEYLDNEEPAWVDAWFGRTLHPSGVLRPFLESWRGTPLTELELAGFDLEDLIGAPAYIQVSHKRGDRKVFVNIDSCMKKPKQLQSIDAPPDYVRVQDREDDGMRPRNGRDESEDPPIDDDLPF